MTRRIAFYPVGGDALAYQRGIDTQLMLTIIVMSLDRRIHKVDASALCCRQADILSHIREFLTIS